MHPVEAGYTGFVDTDATPRRALAAYAALAVAFAARGCSVHTTWLPAAVPVVMLVLFVADERKGVEP